MVLRLAIALLMLIRVGSKGALQGSLLPPLISPTILKDWYVAPDGLDTNLGTLASPWPWNKAAAGAGGLIPSTGGHRVNVVGGEYTGALNNITIGGGSSSLPTIFRAYDPTGYSRQRARFRPNNGITIDASHVWIHGLERSGKAGARRISTQIGGDSSAPGDVDYSSWQPGTLSRDDIREIHCVQHDVISQTFVGTGSPNYQKLWCLDYNIGWEGPDRGHAHPIYEQNNFPSLHTYKSSVFYGSFDNLAQVYASSGFVKNILIEGCALSHAGDVCKSPPGGEQPLFVMRHVDETKFGSIYLRKNSIFTATPGAGPSFGDPNHAVDFYDFEFTDNVVQGTVEFAYCRRLNAQRNRIARVAALDGTFRNVLKVRTPAGLTFADLASTVDYNDYAWVSNAAWKGLLHSPEGAGSALYDLGPTWRALTGWDTNSTYTNAAVFPAADIRYYPSEYEPTRGFLHCFNWQNLSTLPIDLSRFGFQPGMLFEIMHCYDYYGVQSLAGEYTGASVSLGQTGYTRPLVEDYANQPPLASASPRYNIFEVRRTG